MDGVGGEADVSQGYWEWQLRQWEDEPSPKSEFRLRPVLPIVLYTGDRPWGSPMTLRELLDEPKAFHAFVPDWRPIFWELNKQQPDDLVNGPDAFLQALAILTADRQELEKAKPLFLAIFQRLEQLAKVKPERWAELVEFQLGWACHKRPRDELAIWNDLAIQAQSDAALKRRIEAMATTAAQELQKERRPQAGTHARPTGRSNNRRDRASSPNACESRSAAIRSARRGDLRDIGE